MILFAYYSWGWVYNQNENSEADESKRSSKKAMTWPIGKPSSWIFPSLSISWCYFVTDVSIHILTRYAIHKISLWASKDSRATSTKAEKTRGHKWEDIDCLWAINLLLSTFDGLNQVSSFGNSREISKIRWVTPLTHKLIYNVCRPIAIRDPSIQVYDQH